MRVDEIFTLLEKKYFAYECPSIGSEVHYRKDLMQNFYIDFSFKWSTCMIELYETKGAPCEDLRYFASEYWINEEAFKKNLEDTIEEYIVCAKNVIQQIKLNNIKEDFR